MSKFSSASLKKLQGLDDRLIILAKEVVTNFHDCTVIYGLRTLEEQKKLFAEGLSKTMKSRHLNGYAIDLSPYPIDWNNIKRFYYFAGIVITVSKMKKIPIRWGGDWDMDNDLDDQTFMDLVHFEIPRGKE